MTKHDMPAVHTDQNTYSLEALGEEVSADSLSAEQLASAIPAGRAISTEETGVGSTGSKLIKILGAGALLLAACSKTPQTPVNNGNGTKDTIIVVGPGNTYYIVDKDTVLITKTDTVNFGTIIEGSTGDTLHVNGTDTTRARRVKVDGGFTAMNFIDPMGDMDIVHKMEAFSDYCVIEPGYYNIPSNPTGRVRTTAPANGVARINVSHIDPSNGYQRPLYDAIQAIPGGFLTQSVYPGYNMPNFANPAVATLVTNFCNAARNDCKGLYITGLDNITNVAKTTGNKPELDNTLSVLRTVSSGTKGAGKKMIISDFMFQHPSVNVAAEVAKMTTDLSATIPYPIDAGALDYYTVALRAAQNAANADITMHVMVPCTDNNNLTTLKTMAAALRDQVGKPARQGTHTVNFKTFFAEDNQYLNVSDLDANHVYVGTLAMVEQNAPHTHVACNTNAVKWYDQNTRSFEYQTPHLEAVKEAIHAHNESHHFPTVSAEVHNVANSPFSTIKGAAKHEELLVAPAKQTAIG